MPGSDTEGSILLDGARIESLPPHERFRRGLARTFRRDGYSFDLGGHRFITKYPAIDAFVRSLMDGELVSVPRSSKIYMRGKYFDYPLRPLNAMFGLGIPTTANYIIMVTVAAPTLVLLGVQPIVAAGPGRRPIRNPTTEPLATGATDRFSSLRLG